MIYPGPLTKSQRRKSQKNFNRFNLLNGMSYMCLGETIIILLAVKLNAPNSVVAILGAMMYFAYIMLPLGKVVAARVGAAQSQAIFWAARNVAALGVAASAVVDHWGFHYVALGMIVVGSCVFYGFRSAGVMMSQPLFGDVVAPEERAEFQGRTTMLFYTGCITSLVAIWWVLGVNDSVWVIASIIAVGSCIGITSTRYIRRIDETAALREAARRPWKGEIREIIRNRPFRRIAVTLFISNMGIIFTCPVSMLAIKRGYGVSDTNALFFSLIQFASAAGVSYLTGKLVAKLGARWVWLGSYLGFIVIAFLWILAPGGMSYIWLLLTFFMVGGTMVLVNNISVDYFLAAAPAHLRVAGSLILLVITGFGPGVLGMIISGSIFRIIGKYSADWVPLSVFKVYFLLIALILGAAYLVVRRLPDKSRIDLHR